jgi:predicted nuclease of predicted toxin-antitoxin system
MLRVLLDAQISSRVIAKALRSDGHDVLAISEDASLEGLDDPAVLEMAVAQHRILVTHDVRDFAPLLRSWAESGRTHPGCILVHGIGHREFGRALRGLRRLFAERSVQDQWTDIALLSAPAVS